MTESEREIIDPGHGTTDDPVAQPDERITDEGQQQVEEGQQTDDVQPDENQESDPQREQREEFYQTKYQEAKKRIDELQTQVSQFDTSVYDQLMQQDAPKEQQPPSASYDDDDDPYMARLNQIEQRLLATVQQQQEMQKQQHMRRAYNDEVANAVRGVNSLIQEGFADEETVDKARQYALQYVDPRYPGGPTKFARLVLDYVHNSMAQQSGPQTIAKERADAAARAKAAAMVEQPHGTPTPDTPNEKSDKAKLLEELYAAGNTAHVRKVLNGER